MTNQVPNRACYFITCMPRSRSLGSRACFMSGLVYEFYAALFNINGFDFPSVFSHARHPIMLENYVFPSRAPHPHANHFLTIGS